MPDVAAPPSASAPPPTPHRPPWRRILGIALAALGGLILVFLLIQWIIWPDVGRLATADPENTAFIEAYRARRRAAGEDATVSWRWVEWDRISVHLKRAVVAAEDMEFFSHAGFSASEMEAAVRDALAGERFRGASTITQQLAKNLWLSPSRNPWRKVKEALLTRSLERHLSKRRILAIYLNVVEFGPGIYGAEAAARRYFGVSAADLTEHQAAMLAAGLPRPSTWHPGAAGPAYARYVADIERRMARATFLWRAVGAGPVPELPPLDSLIPAIDSLAVPPADSVRIPDSLPDSAGVRVSGSPRAPPRGPAFAARASRAPWRETPAAARDTAGSVTAGTARTR
jgi:monofunctional biosynthetic peptidoglycan transglycosylase